jgi:hypothetical protein
MRVYKYCSWEDEYTEKNIRNHTLFYQNPAKLNDPYDINPIFHYEGSDEELIAHQSILYQHGGQLSKQEADQKALNDYMTNPRWSTPEGRDELAKQMMLFLREQYGVCSFSTIRDSIRMWSYYADKHKGICLEFTFPDKDNIVSPPPSSRIPNVGLWEVDYAGNRPMKINLVEGKTSEDEWLRCLLFKGEEWEHEKEWRSIIPFKSGFSKEDREVEYDERNLTSIIMGCTMGPESIPNVVSLAKSLRHKPKLIRAGLKQDTFGLGFEEYPY